ncbi:C1 family peptidase [Ideonella oryzae]|uniref:C1 family peptidase n=1 Tax=Ideonella oryzae TaxID=2937441 RepID=A0ABT1BGZ0_9BURK|nr:C1 family peptidase [Ideonella oryzae]MCO5975496.1 C1 family peptidase [Ideonella oryzae]
MPTKNVVIGQRSLTLDARPDRLDLRDRAFQPQLGSLPAAWPSDADVARLLPAYAAQGLVLDQGQDGACTGFGLAAVINYLLFLRNVGADAAAHRQVSPAMLYQLARLYDEWPGEDYEGSSCRGALKGWQRHGVCASTLWPYAVNKKGQRQPVTPTEDPARPDDPDRNWDVDALRTTLGVYYRVDVRSVVDMQAAIRQVGALYVSGTVHEGWAVPTGKRLRGHADLVAIQAVAQPKEPGGHAFALVGYNERGFVVQNSWGPDWGSKGFALLPYADWVNHGSDAWVFTLGVPAQLAPATAPRGRGKAQAAVARSPRFLLPSPSAGDRAGTERPAGLVGAEDALARRYRDLRDAACRPLDPDPAYRHTVVLDRGFAVRNDITAEDAAAALEAAVLHRPLAALPAQGPAKLLIYAHGGLNSEADAIRRIRVMAPYMLAQGIYPLFITWRSGPLETLGDLVEEQAARHGLGQIENAPARGWLDRLTQVSDRMLEPALRGPGGAMWSQMKLNAQRASEHAQGGVRQMVAQLRRLQKERPELEIHLMGHSAGAILLGAMLPLLQAARLTAASLRLFAPACTVRFALDHLRPALQKKVLAPERLSLHVLSDANEQDDSVGPYRKSLLYLVSRAFEDVHKMPLLGMARAFDPASAQPRAADDLWAADRLAELRQWQAFWATQTAAGARLEVLSARSVSDGLRQIPASHGCFDNAVDLIGQALGAIVNPDRPVKVKVERLAD